ncbi:metal-dependent hydrolase family protein [Winogradskyella bathintestinalis]|uniref:Amidohydrolase family protein n=1 Tax=Winogradskyella bathintestinalis TaxID=3035208 RepID=A0ABT7ZU14_9FLAO|nr:amidohydrolase family protein [Winogradskyella bathintestinalis]MDN3492514.1 amidohydrolase family protein [Winogradskyella bathintestinalis]
MFFLENKLRFNKLSIGEQMLVVFLLFIFFGLNIGFAQQSDIYIKAGILYDSEQNELLRNKVIHVKNTEIVSVGTIEMIPENAEIIDLSAYTVLPGFIDAHTHVLFSQDATEDFSEHSIHSLTMESDALRTLRGYKRAKSYLDVGITSVKDLGNSGLFLDVALRDAINEGTIEGPRIFASGPIMGATGGQVYGVSPKHQNLIDLEYRIINGVEDAQIAVREHVNQKVDLIKICADNIPNNTHLSIDEMKAIVKTANSYGLTVVAHSITNQSAWNAIQAGVSGIEHGFKLADSTLTLMAQKEVFLVPTENSRTYMKTYSKLASFDDGDLGWVDNYIDRMKGRLTRVIAKGVTIVAGSDNYTDIGGTRGESSIDMFRAYFEAGMKPLDILQSATYLSAFNLNMKNDIGVLKAQAKADIIAVKGDITKNFISTIEAIVFVMKDGDIYKSDIKQINKSK